MSKMIKTEAKDKHLDRWTQQALALSPEDVAPPSVPVPTYLQEADGVALFLDKSWEPARDRPGLRTVAQLLPRAVAGEIRELVQSCRATQTQALFPDDPEANPLPAAMDEGRAVAGELRAALEYVLDDGVEASSDTALAAASQREDGSPATLAQALSDYAGIAEKNLGALCRIEGLGPGLIARARALSDQISSCPPPARGGASATIELRNRLLTLLDRRVVAVRRAARYVFRHQPELVRQVTSEYNRRQRALHRRRAAGKAQAGADGADAPTAPAAVG